MGGTRFAPTSATTSFRIPVDHPALPGHFPGAPVVPGVLLLAEGLLQLGRLAGMPLHCRRIDSAKFLQPVAPGTEVTATLSLTKIDQGRIEFFVDDSLVAHLSFTSGPVPAHG